MIKGNLGLLCVGFYNSSWGLFSFGWREGALKSWSKYLVLLYWRVLWFFLSLHPCWALVTCLNSRSHLTVFCYFWFGCGAWRVCECSSRGSVHVTVTLHSQGIWLRAWALCLLQQNGCDWRGRWDGAFKSGETVQQRICYIFLEEINFDRNEGKLCSLGILLRSPTQFHSVFSN